MRYNALHPSTRITSIIAFLLGTSILSLFSDAALFFGNLPSHVIVNIDIGTGDSLQKY